MKRLQELSRKRQDREPGGPFHKTPRGPKVKRTAELVGAAARMLVDGYSIRQAGRILRLPAMTLYRWVKEWRQQYPDLWEQIQVAKAKSDGADPQRQLEPGSSLEPGPQMAHQVPQDIERTLQKPEITAPRVRVNLVNLGLPKGVLPHVVPEPPDFGLAVTYEWTGAPMCGWCNAGIPGHRLAVPLIRCEDGLLRAICASCLASHSDLVARRESWPTQPSPPRRLP